MSSVSQLLMVRRLLRAGWFVLGVLLLGWLVWRNIPPDGKLGASARTAEPNGFIDGFTPLDRAKPVQENGLWYSDVGSEPVYFHVAAPRLYGAARVRLRYKEEGQPFIGLGVRTDLAQWSFDVKPIDLPMLDRSGWEARQDGELRVYERKGAPRSAQEVLKAGGRVAVLGIDPARWSLRLPMTTEKPIETALDEKGSRSLYVYVQDGPLEVALGLRGPEDAAVQVGLVREGKTLLSRTHRGNGAVELALTGAEPGLYRIDLRAPGSVALAGVRSRHARLVLLDTAGEHLHAPPGAVHFDPEFPILTWEADLKTAPYDALVVRYRPPAVDAEGWRTAEARFDLASAAVSQGRIQMVLSLPGIKARGGRVRIDRVDVEYEEPRLEPRKLLDLFKLKL